MMSLSWIEKLVPVLFLGLIVGVLGAVGCGETATTSNESTEATTPAQTSRNSNTATAATGELTARSLTGVWLGEAVLDRQKLQQKVDQLAPEAQELIGAKAKSFLTTEMAMEFRENGTVENAVEILSADGKLLKDGSVASWHVLESKPNGLLVQMQERLADGTVASDQLFYQFSADRNRIAIKIPVAQELEGCDAMILFERQTLPPTNVANRTTETLRK